ncbi:MAG: ATP-binding protein [Acidimicrobiaceae bacterium]|nr:ATP-binding protein [Acidimicrobiaceae bacterium]
MTDNAETPRGYSMRISRLTIDKLGVKLYDRASAVIAELIANSYDADARNVTVRVPLATQLDKKPQADQGHGVDWEIVVEDDGHGMTPEEATDHYLKVGRDRRVSHAQGATSRSLKRPVMGRKGIGKLAPFGICRQIEVLSAGGENTRHGYVVSHFLMNFDDIVLDEEGDAPLQTGDRDRTFQSRPGTAVTLRNFLPKRVPNEETFHRQLGRRFARIEGFAIAVEDTRGEPDTATPLMPFEVPVVDSTRIDLGDRPVPYGERSLPVRGWVGMATESYRNEEEAGVRIYARNKIVATTHDFGQISGFTGEFTARSYLVGEIHAEWLDEDAGEDLIRTDRQGILWDSDHGQALQAYGKDLVREVARRSREPRRRKVYELFLEKSGIEAKARERFEEGAVVEAVSDLAKKIGSLAAEDELDDEVYVSDLSEIILAVAPHKALIDSFREFAQEVSLPGAESLDRLVTLFGKTRVAELASYAQIAAERVQSIEQLKRTLDSSDVEEKDLQKIISSAPWLVRPDWTVITANQTLRTLRDRLTASWSEQFGEAIDIAISHESKRPDLTLVSVDNQLYVVELKKPRYTFGTHDFDRLYNYVHALERFKNDHPQFFSEFAKGWCLHLVVDEVSIADTQKNAHFESLKADMKVVQMSWNEFLLQTSKAHERFLDVYDAAGKQNADHAEGEQ